MSLTSPLKIVDETHAQSSPAKKALTQEKKEGKKNSLNYRFFRFLVHAYFLSVNYRRRRQFTARAGDIIKIRKQSPIKEERSPTMKRWEKTRPIGRFDPIGEPANDNNNNNNN